MISCVCVGDLICHDILSYRYIPRMRERSVKASFAKLMLHETNFHRSVQRRS